MVDCRDYDAAVHPNQLELGSTVYDDNCNGRRAMLPGFTETAFLPVQWASSGSVSFHADGVTLNGTSTVTRSGLTLSRSTASVVALKVASLSGTTCNLQLNTSEPGVAGGTWKTKWLTGTGVQLLDFRTSFSPPEVIKQVRLQCGPGSTLDADWLVIQDALEEFGPPAELSVTWKDTRLPAGAHSVAVVRDDTAGMIYFGDDVSGVSRYNGMTWEVANGSGAGSLLMGGTLGVADIFPLEDATGEVYALMGEWSAKNVGGLWRSTNSGDTWEQLASSEYELPGQSYAAATHDDDVMGDPRSGHCGSDATYQIGGALLAADARALTPPVIYMANADPQSTGVAIWDDTESCALPHTGDALPADLVGALLYVEAEPYGTPALVVGFRGRVGGGDSLYVCELDPAGASCSGAVTTDCQQVELGDGAPDVRDLELNTWRRDVWMDTTATGVLVVDSGGRPAVEGDTCDYTGGTVGELLISDSGSGGLSVTVVDDLITGADVPDVAAGVAMTGVSLDGDSEYVFVNTPMGPNSRYSVDRAIRVLADDLLGGFATPVFQALNRGMDGTSTVPMNQEDPYEEARRIVDLDLLGTWLGADTSVRPNVFPARSAPGAMPDFEWLTSYTAEQAEGPDLEVVMGINGNHGWVIAGLDEPWTDNEVDEATFNPTDTTADAENDVAFAFLPWINHVDALTPQGTSCKDVAMGPDGHIWSANGDVGIAHHDMTVPATLANPAGAEIDCLWAGWRTSSQSIHVVSRRFAGEEGDEGEVGDPVIWATVRDQSSAGYDHAAGVVRSMNNGGTWEYAGAGFMDGTEEEFAMAADWESSDAKYGNRACLDEDTGHVMTPFEDLDGGDEYDPAHAFSSGTSLATARLITTATIGRPRFIRALDEHLAVLVMGSDDGGTGDGGLYLTTNGGSTWEHLDFDPGPDSCDEATMFASAAISLRPAPHDDSLTPWDGSDGALELVVGAIAGAASANCALARVVVTDLGSTPATDWTWVSLPTDGETGWNASSCGVSWENLTTMAVAPWAPEVMIGGSLRRNWSGGAPSKVLGGACLINLETGARKIVIDPRTEARGVGAVEAHPSVSDLWVVFPELDGGTYQECTDERDTAPTCLEPVPILVSGNALGITRRPMSGRPPHLMVNSAVWSDLGVDDDSSDGKGSYIVAGIDGGGVWRGELSW